MSNNESYDGSICMNRKLTEEETHELRIKLIPYFTTDGGMGVDDMSDFLDYIFTMVSNAKAVDYVVKELDGFCSPDTSKKIGRELAEHIKLFNGPNDGGDTMEEKQESSANSQGKRVVSLKSSEEKGNALTMAGALGASREGGKNKDKLKPKPTKEKPETTEAKKERPIGKKEERNRNDRKDNNRRGGDRKDNDRNESDRKDNDRRGSDRKNNDRRGSDRKDNDRKESDRKVNDRRDNDRMDGRGNRSVQASAFDRLSKASDRRDDRGRETEVDRRRDDRDSGGRGRGDGRGPGRGERGDNFDRTPRRDDRAGRGGRGFGGRGPRDMGGRGGRDGGRDGGRFGRGGRGDSLSGQRRPRDDLEEQPDFVPADERGGRGHGTPGSTRLGQEGPKRPRYEEGGYDDGYGYDGYGGGYDYYNDGYGFSPYPPFRGGRGGRGRGRGWGRGGRGFEGGVEAPVEVRDGTEGQEKSEEGAGVVDGAAHPSPMVQAAFGGAGFSGRAPFRGGRGRGRGRGGRAQIVSMIQSRTWVRKKEEGNPDNNTGASEDNES